MNLFGSSSNFQKRRKKGFALILTLALISFVFLLVITLVNQVRMEFSFTESRQNQVLAKAHARMGMMIAIGEIQKHLGPDTRVSATADIYDERLSFSDSIGSVDLNEDGVVNTIPVGQRMWTGVWKNRGGWAETKLATLPLPENRDDGKALTLSWSYDSSYDPHPAIEVAWLVSGNEGWQKKLAVLSSNNIVSEFIEVPDGIIIDDEGARVLNQPTGDVYGKEENPWADHKLIVEEMNRTNAYYHPLLSIGDDEQKAWLLKRPVLSEDYDPENIAHQNNWEQYLRGDPVVVPKTAIYDSVDIESGSASEQSQNWNDRKGSYAYWVGDEGVKAKINISVPELTNEAKLKVAALPNIGEGSFGIISSPPSEDKRKDLLTKESITTLLDTNLSNLGNHYHSITTDSFGVLADVRTGGLKRDLSQAFSLDSDSTGWREDFESNFIYRDRVRALKNIPLNSKGERNEWYVSAGDATVDDPDALLAGPPWSVLADFHNISIINEKVPVKAPDQFPRTVGDNALIFGDLGPNSPRGAFGSVEDAYPYYNCFRSTVRKIRPEPKNHPILPILVDFKYSFCPVALDVVGEPSKGEIALALSPAITLWNPYNHEMTLDNLYLEVPFSNHHGRPGETSLDILGFDLVEYDLYRKWWAYMYDTNNSEDLTITKLSEGTRPYYGGNIKKKYEPWGIFDFGSGSSKTTLWESKHPVQFIEPGLLKAFRESSDKPSPDPGFVDSNLDEDNWRDRKPPDSMYGIYLTREGNKYTIYHESARLDYVNDLGQNENPGQDFFVFNSVNKPNPFSFDGLYLKISSADGASNVTLLPGEVNTFAVYNDSNQLETVERKSTDPEDPNSPKFAAVDIFKREDGAIEKASVLKTGEQYDSNIPESLILDLYLKLNGIAGYVKQDEDKENNQVAKQVADNFDMNGYLKGEWGSKPYLDPICLTLWQGDPSSKSNSILTKWVTHNTVDPDGRSKKLATTVQYLKENFDTIRNKSSQNTNLLGMGLSVSMNMPGSSTNERVQLVEFNTRALVHSTQQGQGYLLNKTNHFAGEKYYFNNSSLDFDNGFKPRPQLNLNNEYTEQFSYKLEDRTFAFNVTNNSYSPKAPKSFPDIFSLPNDFDPVDFDFNNKSDVFERASLIGFGETGKTTYPGAPPLFNPLDNPDLDNPKVPASSGQERVGFWSRNDNSEAPFTGKFSGSRNAILFEIPEDRVLSLLEYRHANLNNYLHGPDYSLGNSYASTQVARHRTWGRVYNIESKPTSEQGLTNLMQNKNNYDAIGDYFEDLLGKEIAKIAGIGTPLSGVEGWDWGVDFSFGFGPWRSENESQNHQNTTIDHSYYLNRALLDGFFLSGKSSTDNFSILDNKISGERYRPLLWIKNSTNSFTQGSNLEAVGNPRLVAYERENNWIENLTPYKSGESVNEYPYQTLAGDLLLEGAFNINSTSKDAWIAQLSSLRGLFIQNGNINQNETPVVRFIREPNENEWNKLRKLTDEEISQLAEALVEQIKLRGPFLSMADFVNRKLALGPMDIDSSKAKGTRVNFVQYNLNEWTSFPEDRYSAQGLRGPVQSAIAAARLNDDNGTWVTNSWIPEIPRFRYDLSTKEFFDSSFGLKASALNLDNNKLDPTKDTPRNYGSGLTKTFADMTRPSTKGIVAVRAHNIQYKSTNFGEAPENLLAVEHLATAANKPGWVMQSDLLSPLIPVTSARSDTFVIRVQGDTNSRSPANVWIELVVQRTPDYVKSDKDYPHHRPHEPFKDKNLNGFWDNGRGEHWIDLNQNADVFEQPDLPGSVGVVGAEYRDGLTSDKELEIDTQEERRGGKNISYLGTNQRFGRKFKIVRFRWLRANEV